MADIVYVLTNESMPGLVKIGRTTTSIEQRIKQLDTTSVALPFQCFYAAEVADCVFVESKLHIAFAHTRVRLNREFFRIDATQAAAAVQLAALKDVTPKNDVVNDASDSQAMVAAVEKAERRARLKFSALGIPTGAVLSFAKDTSITCVVVGDGQVSYDGETLSSSASALKAIRKLGYNWSAVSGSDLWMYEDETLVARRERLEVDGG